MNSSLIHPDHHFAVAAALFAMALFGFWAERQVWGKLVTGALWAILGAIIASNLRIVPRESEVYGFVFHYLVPALIPLFLVHANLRRILLESGRVGIAFILACTGTSLGAVAGFYLLDLGPRAADLAGIFTATYTGGSVNYAAVIQATGFDDANVISAATAVDNLMSAIFLAGLAMLPASTWLMSRYAHRPHRETEKPSIDAATGKVTGFTMAACIVFALTVVAISDTLVHMLNHTFSGIDFSWLRFIFITGISIVPSTLFPKVMSHLRGAEILGLMLAFVFFAAIAAGADITKLLESAPVLLAFVLIILAIHALVVFGLGWFIGRTAQRLSDNGDTSLFALSLPELVTGSNAAILGATTAPALAMARGWTALTTPGVLAGVTGYVVGTPLGLGIVTLLR